MCTFAFPLRRAGSHGNEWIWIMQQFLTYFFFASFNLSICFHFCVPGLPHVSKKVGTRTVKCRRMKENDAISNRDANRSMKIHERVYGEETGRGFSLFVSKFVMQMCDVCTQ